MNRLNGNSVLIIGAVLMSLGFFVVSVTSVLFFLLGISMLGFAAPFTILPLFPLMRNSLKKDDRNSSEAINVLSGLYNAALGIGAIVGPLIGSNLYYYFDFFTTAFVLGSSCILLAMVLFFSGGCSSNEARIESSELSEHLGMINGSYFLILMESRGPDPVSWASVD